MEKGGFSLFYGQLFFFPTFPFSPITDCPSLGQILFMIVEQEEGVVGPL